MPTIWISRPPHRAEKLAAALKEHHLQPLLYAAMCIRELADESALESYLANIDDYTASVFVSREAVTRVAQRLSAATTAPTFPALAIGSETAAALPPCYQLLQPASTTISDSRYLLQAEALQGTGGNIAILGGSDEANTPPAAWLCEALVARGHRITAVPCYCRHAAAANATLAAQGQAGEIDGAVAYSGDSLRFMLQMTAPHNDWLRVLPLFVIHANIATTAAALGFSQVVPVEQNTIAAEIARYFVSLK